MRNYAQTCLAVLSGCVSQLLGVLRNPGGEKTIANILCLLYVELRGDLKSAQFPKVFVGAAGNL